MMYPVVCRGKDSKHLVMFFNETSGVIVKPTDPTHSQGDKFTAAWPCTDPEVWEVIVVLGAI